MRDPDHGKGREGVPMEMTRRHFLEQVGALGGSALLAAGLGAFGVATASAADAPPALRGSGKGRRVIILGAGHAGQTSAYELTKLGYDCVILEARGFAGGRCQTARRGKVLEELGGERQTCRFDEGQYLNIGPWRIPYHHRSTLHYTREFDVPLEIMVNDNDASYVRSDKGSGPLVGKPVRKMEVLTDLRGHASEMLAKAASSGQLGATLSADDKEAFIAYLVTSGYLSTKDLTYSGTEARGYARNPGAGLQAPERSEPHSLDALLKTALWQASVNELPFEQQRTMFQPVGGMDQIAKAFEKRVGHLIRYHSEVERVRQSATGVTVDYRDTRQGSRASVTGDYCICAIPLSVVRGLDIDFSAPFKAAMGQVSYSMVGKIGLQMKRRFWELDDQIYGGHVLLPDAEMIQLISLPSGGWQKTKGVVLGAYVFQDQAAELSAQSLSERIETAVAAGEKVFPGRYGANVEASVSWFWHRAPHNLGGWAEWSPEARASAYPTLLEPDGRIYLAGEHLSYLGGWQAGAIESAWAQIEKLHHRAAA